MKSNTVFLALVFAVIGAVVHAQKSYPACLFTDCVGFVAITVGCGYSDSSLSLTTAQMSCICGAPTGPAEYQGCIVCMNLDPTITSPYPSVCSANFVASSTASRPGASVTRSASSGSAVRVSSTRTTGSQTAATRPVSTPGSTAPVVPAATGGNLQGLGGCPNGDCSGGDSSKTNIYDVTKDSDAVSGAGGVGGAGWGWYGGVLGLAAMGGIVWL